MRTTILLFKQRPEHKYYDSEQRDRWTIRAQTGFHISYYHCVTWEFAVDYLKANIGW